MYKDQNGTPDRAGTATDLPPEDWNGQRGDPDQTFLFVNLFTLGDLVICFDTYTKTTNVAERIWMIHAGASGVPSFEIWPFVVDP